MGITKLVVERAAYSANDGGRCVLWDDEINGFGVRIYPSGRKAFVLSYRAKSRKRLMTIGTFGNVTVDQARQIARKYSNAVFEGKDPLEERKREAMGETVADLCKAFLERHSKPKKKSWQADERRINKAILPKWGGHKVKAISRADVASLHFEIGKRSGAEANRTTATLSKMFALAKQWGMLSETDPNPAKGIDFYKMKKRDRWVSPKELPELAKAIGQETNVYVRAAIWLYLFTGVRKSELLQLRWKNIDLERQELCLEETKAGRNHYIPLSSAAISLLDRVPRMAENPYLLPGHIKGQHLVNISKPWLRIRRRAGVEDLRLHDLRRTVGSWLAQSGSSLHLIGRVLNHSNPSTTQIYSRFGQDHVRDALEQHGQRMISAIGLEGDLTKSFSL